MGPFQRDLLKYIWRLWWEESKVKVNRVHISKENHMMLYANLVSIYHVEHVWSVTTSLTSILIGKLNTHTL